MGNGNSTKTRVVPFAPQPGSSIPSTSGLDDTCGMCGKDGNKKTAKWWCENCRDYICNYCAWNHSNDRKTASHTLTPSQYLRRKKKQTPSWQDKLLSKQALLAVYFDTKADLHYVDVKNYHKWNQYEGEEHERGGCLFPQCNMCYCHKRYVPEAAAVISGCAFTPGGYLAVTDFLNEEIKLFDTDYNCTSFLKLEGKPIDICCHDSYLYVALANRNKIIKVQVTYPVLCIGRKLFKKGELITDGNCDSIAIYRHSKRSYGLVLGITIPSAYHTKKHQVHILDMNGTVIQTLFYDNDGKKLFRGPVFVSGSRQVGEVIVSDTENNTIQGFNMRTGDVTFEHHIEKPLGVTTDKRYNIYLITNSCFYWIPPNRHMIVPFLKRGHRSRATNCCYDNKSEKLAVTSSNSETVQIYKILSFLNV